MEIAFRTKKLERCYREHKRGCRAWGPDVTKKFIQRIDLLQEATDMIEIQRMPGLDCHPLKGNRASQYGVTLHDRWRLIISFRGEKAEIIRIEEVSKHYGD